MEYTAQMFSDIEKVLPVLENMIRYNRSHISIEQKIILRELCKTVLLIPNPIMTCDSCVITNLERLMTIYETEFPKFIERNYQTSKNQPEPEKTDKIQKKPTKKKAQ
jgi:hypothetical protein